MSRSGANPSSDNSIRKDQADRLREIIGGDAIGDALGRGQHDSTGRERFCPVLAVASGKGGVGKTITSVNLAVALARSGKRVTLLDADLGTANAEIVLGASAGAGLDSAIELAACSTPTLADVSVSVHIEGNGALRFIAGASAMTQLDARQRAQIAGMLAGAESDSDCILIDTGAGVGDSVLDFVSMADACVLVTTPEPTAIADAYALLKRHRFEHPSTDRYGLVVNQTRSESEGVHVHARVAAVASRFLGVRLDSVGQIPWDYAVPLSVRRGRPVVEASPASPAARALVAISMSILPWACGRLVDNQAVRARSWWERLGLSS